MYAGTGEISDRFGDMDVSPHLSLLTSVIFGCVFLFSICSFLAVFDRDVDPHFEKWCASFDDNLKGALFAAERNSRSKASMLRWEWDCIMGKIPHQSGFHFYNVQRFQ
ncbi:hypothetical protein TraAM80_04737 [Trypanosoma rangeli]|uniref:Uncharacterized protein n=1 Tax=Trypanosoma rangeli TaxID=5698 RepID=A0A3R7NN39_TRYRA|nr:uncharacterized protein TraAM80_04737 [Trypanosoma rangeli]RNF05091.1 hypothetical protein TraAM80_04737 [Trypanosoma rangeli]|eukprot:RNF05091.1 hypothetical protein TraAM80_04737 [Trypanosoma rangeli]